MAMAVEARERELRHIEVRESLFASNDRASDEMLASNREDGLFLLNLMSSTG